MPWCVKRILQRCSSRLFRTLWTLSQVNRLTFRAILSNYRRGIKNKRVKCSKWNWKRKESEINSSFTRHSIQGLNSLRNLSLRSNNCWEIRWRYSGILRGRPKTSYLHLSQGWALLSLGFSSYYKRTMR